MSNLMIEGDLDISRMGRRRLCTVRAAEGAVPRVARLMALALRFENLIRESRVADYSDLARLGHVSRARLTQIMNLLLLAPDIQEAILFMAPRRRGRDPIRLARLQPIALTWNWAKQRRLRQARWTRSFAFARQDAKEKEARSSP
jgi:hypothetical protein